MFTGLAGADSVTARQLVVLSAIDASEGASQTDIVEQTGVDRSTMTDVIKRLCRKKLATRKRAKDDKRAYRLALTEAGRNALRLARAAAQEADDELLSLLSSRERAELMRLMTVLTRMPG